jgi:predicted ribosome quality control (RQC) complex YloA/Tae2 family protein
VGDSEIPELRRILEEMAAPVRGKGEGGLATPGLRFVSGEFSMLVGRNARENDILLRRHVRGNDLWLHTRDYPGGYVFVRAQKGKTVPLEVLLDAGNLAVHFSKAKTNGRAELYYTHVKYLRRVRDGPPGLVLPTHEKNLSVVVEQERLTRLLA